MYRYAPSEKLSLTELSGSLQLPSVCITRVPHRHDRYGEVYFVTSTHTYQIICSIKEKSNSIHVPGDHRKKKKVKERKVDRKKEESK